MPSSQISPLHSFKSDIVIVGAGIMGLSIALELYSRGYTVTVIERDRPLSHASTAAAGMVAANDPHNPPALLTLSAYSASLYPSYLAQVQRLSGLEVPFQTDTTVQHLQSGLVKRMAEHSIDPRQLATSLLTAVRNTSIDLREHTQLQMTKHGITGIVLQTTAGESILTQTLVDTRGAWSGTDSADPLPITPRKGQMLRVNLPPGLAQLREVHRNERIYIVPRIYGPQAGTAVLGATVEDVGFDTAVHISDLAQLRRHAAELLPELADPIDAPEVGAWAGLRPATPDLLPVLGRLGQSGEFVATGHYRNGILLAPGTAAIMADLIEETAPEVDLEPYAPSRFR